MCPAHIPNDNASYKRFKCTCESFDGCLIRYIICRTSYLCLMLSHSPGAGLARKHAVTAVFAVKTARTVVSSRMFAMLGDIIGANCVVRSLARCSFTSCATTGSAEVAE